MPTYSLSRQMRFRRHVLGRDQNHIPPGTASPLTPRSRLTPRSPLTPHCPVTPLSFATPVTPQALFLACFSNARGIRCARVGFFVGTLQGCNPALSENLFAGRLMPDSGLLDFVTVVGAEA